MTILSTPHRLRRRLVLETVGVLKVRAIEVSHIRIVMLVLSLTASTIVLAWYHVILFVRHLLRIRVSMSLVVMVLKRIRL